MAVLHMTKPAGKSVASASDLFSPTHAYHMVCPHLETMHDTTIVCVLYLADGGFFHVFLFHICCFSEENQMVPAWVRYIEIIIWRKKV